MTINAALTAQTSDGVSSGYAIGASGQAKVQVNGDSIMNGARIEIEECSVDTSAKYCFAGDDAVLTNPGTRVVVAPEGYYIRVRQAGSRTGTSITVTITTL